MEISDHVPCLISINTPIPRGKVFRFENYLMEHEHFMSIVQHGWSLPTFKNDSTKIITAKFKNLRRVIKAWQAQLSSLKAAISNVKLILSFMGYLEEFGDLTLFDWNFKEILEDKLISLLRQHKIYWKQRGTLKWVTKRDAGTKFFHANATIRHRKNLITCLENSGGNMVTSHNDKAHILWEAYKERLGQAKGISSLLDLSTLLTNHSNLALLEEPFTTEEIDSVVASLISPLVPMVLI